MQPVPALELARAIAQTERGQDRTRPHSGLDGHSVWTRRTHFPNQRNWNSRLDDTKVRIGRRFLTAPATVFGRFFPRCARVWWARALSGTWTVAVVGPRQSGKATLEQRITRDVNLLYETLNDVLPKRFGLDDPIGVVRAFPAAAIDELRRVPELIRAASRAVDEDRRSGHFGRNGVGNSQF